MLRNGSIELSTETQKFPPKHISSGAWIPKYNTFDSVTFWFLLLLLNEKKKKPTQNKTWTLIMLHSTLRVSRPHFESHCIRDILYCISCMNMEPKSSGASFYYEQHYNYGAHQKNKQTDDRVQA